MTREAAGRVRDAVVEAIDPLEIILFGSVAQATSGNDLDLLVVDRRRQPPPRTGVAASALRSALRPFRRMFDIDDYVVSRSRFAEYLRQRQPIREQSPSVRGSAST